MKFLVLFACVAVASAQLVTYPNGAVVPAKTPEIIAAEQTHFAAKGLPYAAGVYGGAYGLWNGYAGAYNGIAGYGYAAYPYAAAYNGYAGVAGWAGYPYAPALVGHPNGAVVPAEPADVVAARAEHLEAQRTPLVAPVAPAVAPAAAIEKYYAPGVAGLVDYPNGALVPAEPADVVAARAEHLAAKATPLVAPVAPVVAPAAPLVAPAAAIVTYSAPAFAGLVNYPNGAVVPAEPADVVAARAEHLAAHA